LDITSSEAAMSNQPNETVDLSARVDALEQRVARVEAMAEVVTAIRADMATIADGVDSTLAQHVAELESTVENHGLLLAGLLDNE
jgi:archaellum component FlaC